MKPIRNRVAILVLLFCGILQLKSNAEILGEYYYGTFGDINRDGKSDYQFLATKLQEPPYTQLWEPLSFYLYFLSNIENGVFPAADANGLEISAIRIDRPSSSAKPIWLQERLENNYGWGSAALIWSGRRFGIDKPDIYFPPLGQEMATVIGFKQLQLDGIHFGWCRIVGTNGYFGRFRETNSIPPLITEYAINPVPYAPIQLGRPSPGGPKLTYRREGTVHLRIEWPDWGDRYALRRRSQLTGQVLQTYPGGREGAIPTNGFYSATIPIDNEGSYFELFLPPANAKP